MSLRRFTAQALSGSPQSSPQRPRLAAAALAAVTGSPACSNADLSSPTCRSLGSTFNSQGALDTVLSSPPRAGGDAAGDSGLSSPCLVLSQSAGYRTPGALNKKTLAARILDEELGEGATPKKGKGGATKAVTAPTAGDGDSPSEFPWMNKSLLDDHLAETHREAAAELKARQAVLPAHGEDSKSMKKKLTAINKQVKLANQLAKAKAPRTLSGPVVAAGYRHRTVKGQSVNLPTSGSTPVSEVPFLLAQWSGNKRNKLISPFVESIRSYKKLIWLCQNPKCNTQFEARIADQYANKGQCPSCKQRPSAEAVTRESKKKKAAQGSANSQRNFNPELAKGWENGQVEISPDERLFVSPKLDGIRCVVHNNAGPGEAPKPIFLSRRGHVLESTDHLNPIFEKLFNRDPEAVFDGELYNHSFKDNFDALGGAVRCTRRHRTEDQLKIQLQIQYHCFGMMYGEGIDDRTSFADRMQRLRKLVQPFEKSGQLSMTDNSEGSAKAKPLVGSGNKEAPKFVLVSQIECTKASVDAAYQKHLKNGYEGLMVRFGSVPYQFGKRSKALLKVKPVEDSEYKIVGYVEGKGKWEGSLGALVCKTPSGDEFQVTPSVPEERKAEYWKHKNSLIGKMMTVQYQALTNQGIPRFPIGKAIRGSANQKDWL